jgi:hypothetical protein
MGLPPLTIVDLHPGAGLPAPGFSAGGGDEPKRERRVKERARRLAQGAGGQARLLWYGSRPRPDRDRKVTLVNFSLRLQCLGAICASVVGRMPSTSTDNDAGHYRKSKRRRSLDRREIKFAGLFRTIGRAGVGKFSLARATLHASATPQARARTVPEKLEAIMMNALVGSTLCAVVAWIAYRPF